MFIRGWSIWIPVSGALLLVAVFGFIMYRHYGPDLLERQSLRLAGKRAIDCGMVRIGANPKLNTQCALKAQETGRPFRVRYEIRGYDAEVAVSVVRNSDGKLSMMMYDSDISGGGGRGAEDVSTQPCPVPTHLWVNPSGRINCFQQQSSPPPNISSPNSEAY